MGLGLPPARRAASPTTTTTTTTHPVHGVLLSWLCRAPVEDGWTIQECCDRWVRPATASGACSLADAMKRDPNARAFVADVADVFVSYAWSYKWRDLMDALVSGGGGGGTGAAAAADDDDDGAKTDRYIWLDVVCLNQHIHGTLTTDVLQNAFGGALRTINRAEIVLLPWRAPVAPTRSWCTFEWYMIAKLGLPSTVRLGPNAMEEIAHLAAWGAVPELSSDGQSFTSKVTEETWANLLAPLLHADVQNAVAKYDTDRDAILALVRREGVDKVNRLATTPVQAWLQRMLEAKVAAARRDKEDMTLGSVLVAKAGLLRASGRAAEAAAVMRESQAAFARAGFYLT